MTDPNVGVPDAPVIASANVRLRAPKVSRERMPDRFDSGAEPTAGSAVGSVVGPTVCPGGCEGYGVIVHAVNAEVIQLRPCPACRCEVCGEPTSTPPMCRDCDGASWDEQDRIQAWKEASR